MDAPSSGSSHKGTKIHSYTSSFKLKVVTYAKENNNAQAARQFAVSRARVIEWRRNEEKLRQLGSGMKRSRGAGRKVRYPDIEQELKRWMKRRRDAGARVTGTALKTECRRCHRANGDQGFRASCGWLRCFMKRNNIAFRRATHVAQKKQVELDDRMQGFLRYVIRIRQRRHYPLSMIGNMDETPVYVDIPGNYTLERKGMKSITMASTGHEKEKLTVMLAAMADGTKLLPLVILKGVRRPRDVDIPAGIVVVMAPKSWANEEIMLKWLRLVWRRDNQQRRLLVWDAFRAHTTDRTKATVRDVYNSDMAVIPGGCTSKLQPADVSWNRPFKDHFRNVYDDWLVDGAVELTRGGNRKPPGRPLLLRWIKDAWDSVTPDIVRKSFKVCGISSALDGTEDDLLLHGGSDEDNDFEGFTPGDADGQLAEAMAHDAAVAGRLALDDVNEWSDPSDSDEPNDDNVADPASPGH